MTIFSYHLIKPSWFSALKMMLFPMKPKQVSGLIHAETMSAMILGSPIFSTSRFFSREIVVFAQWENENCLNDFLKSNPKGRQIAKGWHLRLEFLRKWGPFKGFQIPTQEVEVYSEENPVVAITIARMRYTEIPRFLRWGRPVEKQVRDDSETTLSLASIQYPNTISTFSIWKSQKSMTDMVFGHSKMSQPRRHVNAMKEHHRKNFHFEFTTLRFRAISEFGEWKNKGNYVPKKK